MQNQRLTRINELLKREIADALYHEMNEAGFDLAAVSITRVSVAPNLRQAAVAVSIAAPPERQPALLGMLRRHRAHIQALINRDLKLKYTPVLHFELDGSIAEGDRVLNLIEELVPDGPDTPAAAATPSPDDAHRPAT
jgi:ribosome-binding factor A